MLYWLYKRCLHNDIHCKLLLMKFIGVCPARIAVAILHGCCGVRGGFTMQLFWLEEYLGKLLCWSKREAVALIHPGARVERPVSSAVLSSGKVLRGRARRYVECPRFDDGWKERSLCTWMKRFLIVSLCRSFGSVCRFLNFIQLSVDKASSYNVRM